MKTRFQGPEASPGFLMWRAALAWQRDIAAALEPVGLTHSQFVLLACTQWLEEHGDGASQVMVATQAGMDVKTTSQVLRRLERAGLVSRQPDPKDARARIVTMTAAGRDVGARATRLVEDADEAYFAAVPHLREALLREAGVVARGSATQPNEETAACTDRAERPKTSSDTAGPTTAAAPPGSALDVGCGDGLLLARLAAVCRRAVGLETDGQAVARARRRLERTPQAEVLLDDVMDLDLPQRIGTFETVACVATLHHLPLEPALVRLSQLVTPGGRLIVVGLAANKSLWDWTLSGGISRTRA